MQDSAELATKGRHTRIVLLRSRSVSDHPESQGGDTFSVGLSVRMPKVADKFVSEGGVARIVP